MNCPKCGCEHDPGAETCPGCMASLRFARRAGSADWRECRHRFEPFFGPIMRCRCGATVAASVDGQPRDIWPPNAQVPPTAPATKEDTSHE